ncbi:MAG: uracil-DNA glycosylase [Spirochaetes bacterium GWD1_27_9]|nr:MAG: uracil-DNA glycosylase [Spirochaetes bacterium GWB1_27_13]OHD22690.1 MAG: uracil-DNA glycosylase [Spirochaetes bacterium GWC1_27_15]OHD35540.1 MAG: uracil-DNA glycosylase [Spirochaetes bacterium GWD1_27_9]
MSLKKDLLTQLFEENKNCQKCKLSTTRNKFVFGTGNPDAKIMFIGEGPGKEEDLQGLPFVGRAGELLTAIIEKGMLLKREDVFIANIVKCRPTLDMAGTRDRPPDREEVESCSWMLLKQIEVINPEVIITLGNPSTKFLLKTDEGITKIRGKFANFNGIPVMPTYHPSYILRNGGANSPLKKDVWEDIKQVLKLLNMPIP